MSNLKLEKAFTLIREVVAEEGKRVEADIIARITRSASPTAAPAAKQKGKRAPKGAAKTFVHRVLQAHPGSTFAEILEAAKTPEEKAISASTVRKELDRGRAKTKEYKSDKGAYSLA
jgi:hypothetical protein